MALQLQDMLMRLSPMPQAQGFGGGADKSLERQRLALMKQEFEETKRKNAEDAEFRRINEAGEMTRARMLDERQRAQQEALAAAETLKQRREAHDVMLKYRDVGDYEGMETAANRLNELGGLAERLGEDENGLPTWRIALDAKQARAEDANREHTLASGAIDPATGDESVMSSLSRMPAIGYDTLNTREPPGGGPGIASSEDLTPEQVARVTGGGTRQQAAGATPEGALTAESSAPGEAASPGSPNVPEYTNAPGEDRRAVMRERVLARGGEAEYGPPTAPVGDTDPSVIKPEYQRTADALDPLAGIRPRSMAPVPAAPADIMGGVPKDVIDTGAMNAQTQRRIGPVMANIEASMPAAYRNATEANNRAAQLMALPADKTLEASLKLRAPADAAVARERDHEFELEKEKTKAGAPMKPHEEQQLIKDGFDRANVSFTKQKLQPELGAMRSAKQITRMLEDDDDANDDKAINFLMALAVQKGAQTDADALRMSGGKISAWSKLGEYLHENIYGGYGKEVRESMKAFAHDMREQSKEAVFSWIHSQNVAAKKAGHPLVAQGYREAVNALPSEVLEEYDAANPPEKADADGPAAIPVSSPGGAVDDGDGNDFEDAVDAAAEAKNLDPDKMRATMGPESGGDGNAKNDHSSASGIIQMLDSVAREYTNPRTGKKFENAAELRQLPREEQAPIAADYFHNKGVTADSPQEDYDLAVAAPAFVGKSADRNAVVYPKGTDKWEANKPWQPKDGGDITVGSILDYYAKNRQPGAAAAKPAASGRPGDAALLEGI